MTATIHAAGAALIAGSAASAAAIVLVSRRPVIAPSLPPLGLWQEGSR
jgi:hypothetical protein